MEKSNILIKGLMCERCVARAKKALEKAGAKNVEITLENGNCSFEKLSIEKAKEIINEIGYEA